MNVLKNYAFSIILITCVILGGVAGSIWGEDTIVVKPIGDLFLNMMFVLIVPMVFFSVSSAICNIKRDGQMVGKLIGTILIVFLVTAVIAALMAYSTTMLFNPFKDISLSSLNLSSFKPEEHSSMSVGDMLIKTLTVKDFSLLFTKNNLLPLIIFSILFGVATSMIGKKGNEVANLLSQGTEVMLKMMNLIMYLAPIGLGCYFAYTIGQLGSQLLDGYLYAFILYLILALIAYVGLNSLYAYISAGNKGVKRMWQNMFTPSLTAIATSSSAACIPVNLASSKLIGIPDKIAETVIPLGTNIHKDGSVMGGILKIVFLITIFGADTPLGSNIFIIVGMAILVGAVMGAIPSGGMTGELLICSVFGFPMETAAALMIISTIIDAPATLVNSTGNIASSMLVARFTGGKDWMESETNKAIED